MIRTRAGKVLESGSTRRGVQECVVECEGRNHPALNLASALGPVSPGEDVLLNTTAVHLGLGTGGYHLVMARLGAGPSEAPGPGHIMKLRYTPWQVRLTSVEEKDGSGHAALRTASDLSGTPVIACGLHSQGVAAALAVHSAWPGLPTAWVVNDAGSLPLGLSRVLDRLRTAGVNLVTITAGHAFGGDLEAVNVHSALLAARHVAGARVVITAMGPGVVGTGTFLGHSEVRQGEDLNAIAALGGTPLAVPRLSGADRRARHRGVSHHTLAVLSRVALARSLVIFPCAGQDHRQLWMNQLIEWQIQHRHYLVWLDPAPAIPIIDRWAPYLRTMGRDSESEPHFFQAPVLAGLAAVDMVEAMTDGRIPGST